MKAMTTPKELSASMDDLETLLNNSKNPVLVIKAIKEYKENKSISDKTLKMLHMELKAIHQKSLDRVS